MKLTLENLPMFCTEEGDCLLWNLSLNSTGKPQARLEGKSGSLVQRYVYQTLMGKQLQPGRRITTRCQNPICVAPGCLFASTFSAILKRSYATGKRSTSDEYAARLGRHISAGKTKLTAEIAQQIRESEETGIALARKHGVNPDTIYRIRQGLSWRSPLVSSVFAWRPAA
jgi:hypothetical protein